MKEYYLIDGYNVINNWQEFADIREKDLEHTRDLLVSKVAEFSAFHGYESIVIFDAMEVAGPASMETAGNCTVVFTAEHETADSWIEKATYRIAGKGIRVFVVTSDRAEQDYVLGSGGFRISAREFKELYRRTKKQIDEKVEGLPGHNGRSELGSRLNGTVANYMEQLRRG